jgi:DNA-binding response OmpR family regulator
MKRTFLIVDDDVNFVTTLQIDLEMDGYIIKTATDPMIGLKEAKRCRPDVILLDWGMLEMDGIEFIRRLRKDDAQRFCHIIMLTGRSSTEEIVEALDAGADDFLKKPFQTDELRARIRSGLRIRELEEQIAAETKTATEMKMALAVADKIGNPIAAAKFYQQALMQHSAVFKSAETKEHLTTLGQLLDEAFVLINNYEAIKAHKATPSIDTQ